MQPLCGQDSNTANCSTTLPITRSPKTARAHCSASPGVLAICVVGAMQPFSSSMKTVRGRVDQV
jgi:hypothetical protein